MTLLALYDVPAPAKLNLFLHVVGRRADGYHLLESVFVLLDWADTLHFERRADGQLRRHDLGVALPPDDLCLRAARRLQAASGCRWGADISIQKHLPSGAGLGGGSSDAASVLLALNRLWGLQWPRSKLLELALPLGADVPFFLGGHNAFVQGIGEQLTPVKDLPVGRFAVVKPPESIATATLFASPLLKRDTASAIIMGSLQSKAQAEAASQAIKGAGILAAGYGHNDLQAAAEQVCPGVAQAARWLEHRFGNSRMTGSGSAVFARVGQDVGEVVGDAGDWLQSLPNNWIGRDCRSLPAHPLVAWAD